MVMLFQGKVEVLEEHNIFVRTVRFTFRLPSVLRLHNYVRVKRPNCIRFSRENVYVRDEHRCQYCVQKYPTRQLTLDHVVPAVQGGKKNWSNIVTCCISCNQKKGGRTPQQAGMRLIKKPDVPTWLPKLQEDFAYTQTPDAWKTYLFAS